MLLAVNVGNSTTAFGLFAGTELAHLWRVHTDQRRLADEYVVYLRAFVQDAPQAPTVDAAVLGSVVPLANLSITSAIQTTFATEPLMLSPRLDLGLPLRYEHEAGLGSDRIANAVAARARYQYPVIVVDAGTATTFDVIDADGAFVGGAIAPGLRTAAEALVVKAAQIAGMPDLESPAFVGRNTRTGLQSGILRGHAAMIDGLVAGLRAEIGAAAYVVGTGGLIESVAPYSSSVVTIDRHLTLHGLRLVHERHSR